MAYARFERDCRWYVYASEDSGGHESLVIFDEEHEEFHLRPGEAKHAKDADDWSFLHRPLTEGDRALLGQCVAEWLIDLETGIDG